MKLPYSVLSVSLSVAMCVIGVPRANAVEIGVAKVDITPSYPIRLNGYGSRTAPCHDVDHRIFARAIAIGGDGERPSILLTVETLGVPATMADEVAARLAKKVGIERERIAFCATHTHTAPCVAGITPLIFGIELPPDEVDAIARYTRELTDHVEAVALAALEDRKPGTLGWTQGQVTFANNRRTITRGQWTGFGVNPGAPVDHALPLLVAKDADGQIRAVLASYACHGTTLSGNDNRISGDWIGFASDILERTHADCVALVAIGCGADSNPNPRGDLATAMAHGESVAREVDRLLKAPLRPLGAPSDCRLTTIELPFDRLPTREELAAKVDGARSEAQHARVNLARLDRGEKLPKTLPYVVQTWAFGDDMAMVFLAGEVVVDYSLRLKRELDDSRLWVNAYSNDLPCYIASKRIMPEGGYEVINSMWLYDRPTKLAPEAEDLIVAAVHKLLPPSFRASSGSAAPESR